MNLHHLRRMAHSPIRNYIVPGLTSFLIGEKSTSGCVRMFVCSRNHEEPIVPHSHRFDFHCVVLEGAVRNILWRRSITSSGDLFAKKCLSYSGDVGQYKEHGEAERGRFDKHEQRYVQGDTYDMSHDQIHSIFFERGTTVLFFEGPTATDTTFVLEPICDGVVVPTFEVRPWMFKRDVF